MNRIRYSIKEIALLLNANAYIHNAHAVITTLATDSRKLSDMDHSLFFALGGRRDGHDFIQEAYTRGIRNFVVSKSYEHNLAWPDANFLKVDNTLQALQSLAGRHRKQFNYPVIAITGSNGKTIVKEWLYQALASDYNIVRSPKSFNSQLGVPLSVWNMNSGNDLALIEAGISTAGEMEALEKIIKPDIGILTTIGQAHQSGFNSHLQKIEEKLRLFKDVSLFIYSPSHLQGYSGSLPGKRLFSWDWNGKADLLITKSFSSNNGRHQHLTAIYKDDIISCTIPFTDGASIENAICSWATLLALGYQPGEAAKRLLRLQAIHMRLELKNGIRNCSVIDDSYSCDISSLTIALDFLVQQNQHPKKTLILSDIPETEKDKGLVYKQVSILLKSKNIDRLIGVGPEITTYGDNFPTDTKFYPDTSSLLNDLEKLNFFNETILLKGARQYGFEQVSKALTQKMHETVMEVNLNALENNLNYYKSLLTPGVKVVAMVKAFSYGSGSFEIANVLQFNKVDYLAVAFADEGVVLRQSGIDTPIIVMNPDVMGFDTMIVHRLEPEIYSFRSLREFSSLLRNSRLSQYPVHLKIDTGMHRSGFSEDMIDELLAELRQTDLIRVDSIFSHFTSSEDENDDAFTRSQIALFASIAARIEEALGYSTLKHLCNTSGISRWPSAQFDMVRLGIGLYGIDSVYNENESPLETVITLKTTISQIKELRAGETVGYNRKGLMPVRGKIATVKIGYADGYSRRLGNGIGKMLVNNQIVPTIGNICMDVCMLDITGVDCKEGDEVIVFNEQLPVQALARDLNTIAYEVLTGISARVKRVYFYE